jgi:hypothetical protein
METVPRIPAVCLFLAASMLFAEEPPTAPAKPDAKADVKPHAKADVKSDIAVLSAAYKADLDEVTAGNQKWSADLEKWYLAGLDKLLGERAKAGDLDGALAFKAERERIAAHAETTRDEIQAMPATLQKLRAAYDEALKKNRDETDRRKVAARSKHLARLDALQKRTTMSGDFDQALLVKAERDRVASAPDATPVKPAEPAPPPAALPPLTASVTPAKASKEQPFVNSLEMRFVPGTIRGGSTDHKRVLFSVWDTRVQDYEVFAQETNRQWAKPGFPQEPTHPAVNVSWDDAQAFCKWLTDRELASGLLPKGWLYRLPTDHEWSCAVGIGEQEDAEKLPAEKDGMVKDVFPWGTRWPPPQGAGNYGGEELEPAIKAGTYTYGKSGLPGYSDDFIYTSPVGSFAPNRYGLYDMGGNVWQWCEDWFDAEHKGRVLRGASWRIGDRGHMQSSSRMQNALEARAANYGFRCVLVFPGS